MVTRKSKMARRRAHRPVGSTDASTVNEKLADILSPHVAQIAHGLLEKAKAGDVAASEAIIRLVGGTRKRLRGLAKLKDLAKENAGGAAQGS